MEPAVVLIFLVALATNTTLLLPRASKVLDERGRKRVLAKCMLFSVIWIAVSLIGLFGIGGMEFVYASPIMIVYVHKDLVGIFAYFAYLASAFNATVGLFVGFRAKPNSDAVTVTLIVVLICLAVVSFYKVFCLA